MRRKEEEDAEGGRDDYDPLSLTLLFPSIVRDVLRHHWHLLPPPQGIHRPAKERDPHCSHYYKHHLIMLKSQREKCIEEKELGELLG